LVDLVERNRAGCERIARMIASGVDSDRPAESVEQGITFCRNLFDWSVAQSSESSVALYSLGNPAILDAATREVVDLLVARRWITAARDVLEIGCGIGRFEHALAPRVRTITGIDVSPRMIEQARARCAGLDNVSLVACTGYDLAAFGDASFDLVMAVDSFPYLVQSGMALVERHFEEARRVLRPGGDLVIFEFSYRGDAARDRDDVSRLAATTGFAVRDNGTRALSLWDGALFHLT
jgi:ubiquinone/menaquinone biosynthesis C-methylase UbiE